MNAEKIARAALQGFFDTGPDGFKDMSKRKKVVTMVEKAIRASATGNHLSLLQSFGQGGERKNQNPSKGHL